MEKLFTLSHFHTFSLSHSHTLLLLATHILLLKKLAHTHDSGAGAVLYLFSDIHNAHGYAVAYLDVAVVGLVLHNDGEVAVAVIHFCAVELGHWAHHHYVGIDIPRIVACEIILLRIRHQQVVGFQFFVFAIIP